MKYSLVWLFLFGLATSAFAEVRLFDSEDIISAKLEMDISYFRKEKENLRENGIPGKFTVNGKVYDVEVQSRGHGSMDNIHPPFKLKFKKRENVGTLFEDIKKIKAFTSPDGTSQKGEQQVLSNYLTYKLLEKINPYSFQTRMFSIMYVDTSGGIPDFESKTFLKEPNKNIASRFNMTYVPFKYGGPNDPLAMNLKDKVDELSAEIVSAFEFIAGNWDHAIPGFYSGLFMGPAQSEKNMKMIMDAAGTYYPIAYDFDMSGFIDRGMCWWEIGYNILKEGRSDHFENVKQTCDTAFIKSHYKEDLIKFHYKNNVLKHYPMIRNKISDWVNDYSVEFDELSPNYLNNLNDYLTVMDEVIEEVK
jgi:hypothetical protein